VPLASEFDRHDAHSRAFGWPTPASLGRAGGGHLSRHHRRAVHDRTNLGGAAGCHDQQSHEHKSSREARDSPPRLHVVGRDFLPVRLWLARLERETMPVRAIRSSTELYWASLRSRKPALLVLHADSCKHCHAYLEGPVREASEDLGMRVWTVRPDDLGAATTIAFPRASQGVPQTAYVHQGCISEATLIGPHAAVDLVMAPHLLPLLDGPIPDLGAFAARIGVPYRNSLGAVRRAEDRGPAAMSRPAGAYGVPTCTASEPLALLEAPAWGSASVAEPLRVEVEVARVGSGEDPLAAEVSDGDARSRLPSSGQPASGAGTGGGRADSQADTASLPQEGRGGVVGSPATAATLVPGDEAEHLNQRDAIAMHEDRDLRENPSSAKEEEVDEKRAGTQQRVVEIVIRSRHAKQMKDKIDRILGFSFEFDGSAIRPKSGSGSTGDGKVADTESDEDKLTRLPTVDKHKLIRQPIIIRAAAAEHPPTFDMLKLEDYATQLKASGSCGSCSCEMLVRELRKRLITLSNPNSHMAAARQYLHPLHREDHDLTTQVFASLQKEKRQTFLGEGTYNVVLASRVQINGRLLGLAVKLAMPEYGSVVLDRWHACYSIRNQASERDRKMIAAAKSPVKDYIQSLLTQVGGQPLSSQKAREVHYDAIATVCMRAGWTPHLMPLLGGAWVQFSDSRTKLMLEERKFVRSKKPRQGDSGPQTTQTQEAFRISRATSLGYPKYSCKTQVSSSPTDRWPSLARVGLVRIFPQAEERLLDWLRRTGKNPRQEAEDTKDIIFQVLHALTCLDAACGDVGFVHGDLKSDQILVSAAADPKEPIHIRYEIPETDTSLRSFGYRNDGTPPKFDGKMLWCKRKPRLLCAVNDFGFSSPANDDQSKTIRHAFARKAPYACERNKWAYTAKKNPWQKRSKPEGSGVLSKHAADFYSMLYCSLRSIGGYQEELLEFLSERVPAEEHKDASYDAKDHSTISKRVKWESLQNSKPSAGEVIKDAMMHVLRNPSMSYANFMTSMFDWQEDTGTTTPTESDSSNATRCRLDPQEF